MRVAGMTDIWAVGETDLRTAGEADMRTAGVADIRTAGEADMRAAGEADIRTAGSTAEAGSRDAPKDRFIDPTALPRPLSRALPRTLPRTTLPRVLPSALPRILPGASLPSVLLRGLAAKRRSKFSSLPETASKITPSAVWERFLDDSSFLPPPPSPLPSSSSASKKTREASTKRKLCLDIIERLATESRAIASGFANSPAVEALAADARAEGDAPSGDSEARHEAR